MRLYSSVCEILCVWHFLSSFPLVLMWGCSSSFSLFLHFLFRTLPSGAHSWRYVNVNVNVNVNVCVCACVRVCVLCVCVCVPLCVRFRLCCFVHIIAPHQRSPLPEKDLASLLATCEVYGADVRAFFDATKEQTVDTLEQLLEVGGGGRPSLPRAGCWRRVVPLLFPLILEKTCNG